MRRRKFTTLIGGAAVGLPLAVQAQQPERTRRIGALMLYPESDSLSQAYVSAFLKGLNKLGWIVGRNIQIDYRWGVSGPELARSAAGELVSLAPDVILANSVSALRGAQQATRTIPIVFTAVSEPVALGFVTSLAQPGGNTTGFTNLESSVGGKWLELLREIAPNLTRVAFMFNPASTPAAPLFYRSVEAAAPKLAVETIMAPVQQPSEIEAIITKLADRPGGGLIIPPDTYLAFHHKLVVDLAQRNRLPGIYPFRYYAVAGGLVAYGPDVSDEFRRAAEYVNRIFHGEKPGDLPVQQPIKFELVINLKAAKALGLDVSSPLQQRADELIE